MVAEPGASALAKKSRKPRIDFELGDDEELAEIQLPSRAKQSDVDRPVCPIHNCLMQADRTQQTITYYYCQVDGCLQREKKGRPGFVAPKNPQFCPRCAGQQKKVACEVDEDRSDEFNLRMACPKCRWSISVPRPGLAELLQKRRRGGKDILDL